MKLYKPKEGETVYYNDRKAICCYVYDGDYIRIQYDNSLDDEKDTDYVLFWLLETMKQNRKKKLDRVKMKNDNIGEINFFKHYDLIRDNKTVNNTLNKHVSEASDQFNEEFKDLSSQLKYNLVGEELEIRFVIGKSIEHYNDFTYELFSCLQHIEGGESATFKIKDEIFKTDDIEQYLIDMFGSDKFSTIVHHLQLINTIK